eukprot:TRINITY_DN2618_c0_g1_i2.p3 TRINITY_DN2618_c0_g1~~TRINITY_DN2618_c0_g1_i2.p3  ORF type:complete len:154 (+),score=35.57 TRINITY_DN2618_c0_g1_i2:355-816(+)
MIERTRRETTAVGRQCELAAYFSHCNLQPIHLMLSLRSAMNTHYKAENFGYAASFARRLLELGPAAEVATQARKVLQMSEQKTLTNAHTLVYDERNPFVVCPISFSPIYKGTASERCSFCAAAFLPAHKGGVCSVCKLGQIGADGTGLKLMQN